MLRIAAIRGLPWAFCRRVRVFFAVVTTLIVLAAIACSGGSADEIDAPVVGASAPAFDAELTTGEPISLDSLRGRPVVLNFWASTCAPCRRELPVLQEVARSHEEDGLVVLAINAGETTAVIDRFMAELSLELPVALDPSGELLSMYEVLVLPMTYFIDRDGVLRYRTVTEPRPKQIAHGLDLIL